MRINPLRHVACNDDKTITTGDKLTVAAMGADRFLASETVW